MEDGSETEPLSSERCTEELNTDVSEERRFNRRSGISNRGRDIVLSESGTFITDIDEVLGHHKIEIRHDNRSADEKIAEKVGKLNYPKGIIGGNSFPGGLGLCKSQTQNYFGEEAKARFYDRCNWINNKRVNSCVNNTDATTQLVYENEEIDKQRHSTNENSELVSSTPFYPVRHKAKTSIITKVVIRTQSLMEGDHFTQQKLVPKEAVTEHAVNHFDSIYEEVQRTDDEHENMEDVRERKEHDQFSSAIDRIHGVMRSINNGFQTAEISDYDPGMLTPSSLKPLLILEGRGASADAEDDISLGNNSLGEQSHNSQQSYNHHRKGYKKRQNQGFSSDGSPIKSSPARHHNIKLNPLVAAEMATPEKRRSSLSGYGSESSAEGKGSGRRRNSRSNPKQSPLAPLAHAVSAQKNRATPQSGRPYGIKTTLPAIQEPVLSVADIPKVYKPKYTLKPLELAPIMSMEEMLRAVEKTVQHHKHLDEDEDEEKDYAAVDRVVDSSGPSMEMVCIDHRDAHNKRLTKSENRGSLFEYIEAERSRLDAVLSDQSDSGDDVEMELEALRLALQRVEKDKPSKRGRKKRKEKVSKKTLKRVAEEGVDEACSEKEEKGGAIGGDGGKCSQEPKNECVSPRSLFIDSCIRKNLNPRASLILRKQFTTELLLQHHGIGDEMTVLFAQAIVDLPYITKLNMADNNLSDAGLGAIVKAVMTMKDLVDLDLSYNTIGPVAACCLAEYLAEETCPLKRLVLRRADVDDGECERFVTALKTNRNLTELDMSENKVGTSENLNAVMPDITTGGEALAELLRSNGCVLSCLKLGWNMIRLDGAIDLCDSLKVNSTLTYLDLSYNALGSGGGMALGDALQDNKTLKTLLIGHNSIDSMACLTIVSGILENEDLEAVSFDGNPIGVEGAKALMLLPTMVGSRVKISATACNIGIVDPKCWFDSSALLRKFELKLEDPFHRAVAIIVLYLVACHQTYLIANSELYDPETRTSTVLGLKERVYKDTEHKRIDAAQLKYIESLQLIRAATSNIDRAVQLFGEIDEDNSGKLDVGEFGNLMNLVGLDGSEDKAREVMAEYDVDNGGYIEMPEFLLFLKNQLKEANTRLKELTEFPIMCAGDDPVPKRYVPPRSGTLTITVVDGFTHKETYRVISGSDRQQIMNIAKQSGETVTMAGYGVQSYKIRLGEAQNLVESLLMENSNKIQILAQVLPHMSLATEARVLVSRVLENNKSEMQRLRREIGYALKPMLGVADGFYVLDLANKMDRLCLNKLLEMTQTAAYFRSKKRGALGYGRLGDCSQHANWLGFRNELHNGKPVVVNTDFATLRRSGRLEFDFVSEHRPDRDAFILNDVRFSNLLVKHHLLKVSDRVETLTRLSRAKMASDSTIHGDGRTVYECPMARAREIGQFMDCFYEHLDARCEQIERYRQKEGLRVQLAVDPATTTITTFNIHQYYTPKDLPKSEYYRKTNKTKTIVDVDDLEDDLPAGLVAAVAGAHPMVKQLSTTALPVVSVADLKGNCSGGDSESDTEPSSVTTSREANTAVAREQPLRVSVHTKDVPLDDFMNKFICLLASHNVPAPAKASRMAEFVIELFQYTYIYARHLELLCELFEELGTVKTSEDFGTYRVDVVVALFSTVVDIHNFEIVLRVLTAFEVACVICRLGWLHLYNPMKPEGSYELTLSRPEERTIVKTLAKLATSEPGDNLPEASFRWERHMDPMPGYELTEPWLTEEGLPKKGIWNATYYAGEGKGKKGCVPFTKLRKSMLQLVHIEEDVVNEIDRDNGKSQALVGVPFLQANVGMWHSYLSYNEADAHAHRKGGKDDKKKKRK